METKAEGPRSFARFVENVGDGDLLRDGSDALFELGNALQDEALRLNTRVKGKITLTIGISCDQRGNVGVDYDLAVKKPKKKRPTAQAWVTKQGNLVFEPPRQTKLPLREMSKGRELADEKDDKQEARDA